MIDEAAIRAIVARLARPSAAGAAGAHIVERAAILAEGSDCAAIEAWILREGGEPQSDAAVPPGRGLHAARTPTGSSLARAAPSRYVLPAGTLG